MCNLNEQPLCFLYTRNRLKSIWGVLDCNPCEIESSNENAGINEVGFKAQSHGMLEGCVEVICFNPSEYNFAELTYLAPQLYDFDIFLEFDFDHWARKVPKLGFLIFELQCGGHGVSVQLVDLSAETVAEDVAPAELQRRKKRKTKVVDAGEPSHLTKKLRGDYGAPVVPAVSEAEVDSVVRTSVPIMTNATTATPTADPAAIAKEKLASASVFGGDSFSAGKSHPISGGFSDRTGGDFLVGGIRIIVDPDSNIQRVYISLGAEVRMRAEYNIKEKNRLKSMVEEKDSLLKFRCDEIKSLKAQLLIKKVKAAEAVCLRDEAQALNECNTYLKKEKSELKIKVTDLATSVKVKDQEVADLDAVVTYVKLQNDSLADQVHKLEVASFGFQEKLSHYENLTERLEEFQDAQMKVVNDKLEKLYADFVDMALHLEEKFYPHLLTTIFGRRWLLTHGMELAITKCLHSSKYLSPCVDQLMVTIHHSPDRVVVGATSLSFPLDVSDARVRKIRENIASQRPALCDVFTPISKPFSAELLTGTRGTSDTVPAPVTTALSITSISASTIPPISTDDYEIAHMEDEEEAVADVEAVADEGADPFPDLSGAELDVSE
nr:hypothetical protein [Tanacetum cinerariifolium]